MQVTVDWEVASGRLMIRGPYEELRQLLNRIGARHWRQADVWTLPATPAATWNLQQSLRQLAHLQPVAKGDVRGLAQQWERQTRALNKFRDFANAELPPAPFKLPEGAPPHWRHQLAGIHAAAPAGGFLLYWGMGAGKTRATCDLIRLWGAKTVLVVAPKKVITHWPKDAAKHKLDHDVVPLAKGNSERRQQLAEEALKTNRPTILVINYESLWRGPFGDWALTVPWDLMVADEIQRIKAPGGKASRFMAKLGPRVKRRLGLSGTPTAEAILDAYGIYRFLDPGIFGTNYQAFCSRYAIMGGEPGRQYPVDFQNTEDFHRRFYSIAFHVSRDVLDLPEITHVERTCTLPPKAKALYKELRDELVTELGEETITAANALSLTGKLRQVATGIVRNEGDEVIVHTEKLKLLQEVLEEVPPEEPVVVFGRYSSCLKQIHKAAERAGRCSRELSGNADDLEEWQAGSGGTVLAVQIHAGGVGVDLTRACYCIYFSQTFSNGAYQQSVAREHRPGQDRPVTCVHLFAEGTIERRVYRCLQKKKDFNDFILHSPMEARGIL